MRENGVWGRGEQREMDGKREKKEGEILRENEIEKIKGAKETNRFRDRVKARPWVAGAGRQVVRPQ